MNRLNFIYNNRNMLKGLMFILCLSYAELGLTWEKSTESVYTLGWPCFGIDWFKVTQTQNELVYGGIEANVYLFSNAWPFSIVRVGGGYRTRMEQDLIGGFNASISLKGNVYSGLEITYQRWEGVLNFKNFQFLEVGASRNIFDEWTAGVYVLPQYRSIILAIHYYMTPNSNINVEIMPGSFNRPFYGIGWHFNSSVQHSPLHKNLRRFPNRGNLRNDLRNMLEVLY